MSATMKLVPELDFGGGVKLVYTGKFHKLTCRPTRTGHREELLIGELTVPADMTDDDCKAELLADAEVGGWIRGKIGG